MNQNKKRHVFKIKTNGKNKRDQRDQLPDIPDQQSLHVGLGQGVNQWRVGHEVWARLTGVQALYKLIGAMSSNECYLLSGDNVGADFAVTSHDGRLSIWDGRLR